MMNNIIVKFVLCHKTHTCYCWSLLLLSHTQHLIQNLVLVEQKCDETFFSQVIQLHVIHHVLMISHKRAKDERTVCQCCPITAHILHIIQFTLIYFWFYKNKLKLPMGIDFSFRILCVLTYFLFASDAHTTPFTYCGGRDRTHLLWISR